MKEIIAKKEIFVVCHNGVDIIHFIELQNGNKLSTSQKFVEEFSTLEEAKKRINELSNNQNYFDENFK